MAMSYTYPGVYVQELQSSSHPITGVPTSIAAFVGYTRSGIDDRAQAVFSFSDFERLYGGLASNSELGYAVQQFFQNGGSQAYVVRTAGKSMGASAASVLFGPFTFSALSSGTAANGNLLIDVNYVGLTPGGSSGDPKTFNVTVTDLAAETSEYFPSVTFDSSKSNYVQTVINDPDNGSQLVGLAVNTPELAALTEMDQTGLVGSAVTPFSIASTLGGNVIVGTVAVTSGSATVSGTGTSFSTALKNGQTIVFGSDVTQTPYTIQSVDSDTGITLTANYTGASASGSTLIVAGPTTIAGTVKITSGNAEVAGASTTFTSQLKFGQWITFDADTSDTPYRILAINSDTSLTLTQNYAGSTASGSHVIVANSVATGDYGLVLNVTQPSPAPAGLPITVKVVGRGSTLPMTMGGLATQIQQAINAVLAVQVPGASVLVSVTPLPSGATDQALRVNALLPGCPDAVIGFGDPSTSTGLKACSIALGLNTTANVAHYALGTGHDGWGEQTTSQAGADGGLPATADLIGDPATFTGIYALQKVDLFNLLCMPDATRANTSDPSALDPNVNPNAIYGAAIALCDQRRAFLLIDPPPNVNTVAGAVDWKSSQLAVVDPNGAAFFPRLRLPDPLNKYQLRTFAPCGVVAGVYATTDGNRGVWKAPAGTAATLGGVQSMVYKLSDPENGLLNPLGLNCFRNFPVYGSVLWGARTLVGADAMTNQWKYVPVRRTALFIEESLYRGTQWVVFEPNDEPLWASIRLNVGAFMQNLFLKGAFQGSTPAQAYFVKCDSETTTQDDIDQGVVNILVGFAPLKPAEFVVIQIEQIAAQPS
jgi:Bacteriophage tail sheath protein